MQIATLKRLHKNTTINYKNYMLDQLYLNKKIFFNYMNLRN